MASPYCEFLIAAESSTEPAHKQAFEWSQKLHVRDLSTRCDLTLVAGEVSPYRHTLYLDGRAFRILNIIKHQHA